MSTLTALPRGVGKEVMRVVGAICLIGSVLAGFSLTSPGIAGAGPVTQATPQLPTSNATGTVPNGACYGTIVASGAPAWGGSGGTFGELGQNGDGAVITASFPVIPGTSYNITTAAGGAGANRDGTGGTGGDAVGVSIDGTVLVVAGGGGGAGSSTGTAGGQSGGDGGDAGIPTGSGTFAGTDGGLATTPTADDGAGGQSNGTAGAGANNGGDAGSPGSAGTPGAGGAGGLGDDGFAVDGPGGGGGGAGYGTGAGGGGGGNNNGLVVENQAGGGGGGTSYVDATVVTAITPTTAVANPPTGDQIAAEAGISWVMCRYDLGVAKTPGPTPVNVGDTATWTVEVTNNGPDDMSIHKTAGTADTSSANSDTVVITDSPPAPYTLGALPANCSALGGQFPVTCWGIAAGESVSIPVSYVVQPADAGATLPNTVSIDGQRGEIQNILQTVIFGGDTTSNNADTTNNDVVVNTTTTTSTTASSTTTTTSGTGGSTTTTSGTGGSTTTTSGTGGTTTTTSGTGGTTTTTMAVDTTTTTAGTGTTTTTNPNVDTDGDGVADWIETIMGTNPNDVNSVDRSRDSDGDGVPDWLEIKNGTDRLNPNDPGRNTGTTTTSSGSGNNNGNNRGGNNGSNSGNNSGGTGSNGSTNVVRGTVESTNNSPSRSMTQAGATNTSTVTASSPRSVAFTGSSTEVMLGLGGVMLLLGSVLAGRRSRKQEA